MYARNYHSYTHLLPYLGIVREAYVTGSYYSTKPMHTRHWIAGLLPSNQSDAKSHPGTGACHADRAQLPHHLVAAGAPALASHVTLTASWIAGGP